MDVARGYGRGVGVGDDLAAGVADGYGLGDDKDLVLFTAPCMGKRHAAKRYGCRGLRPESPWDKSDSPLRTRRAGVTWTLSIGAEEPLLAMRGFIPRWTKGALRAWREHPLRFRQGSSSMARTTDNATNGGGEWRRVTRSEPCQICGHGDWCTIGVKFINCMRVENDRPCNNGGWLHAREGMEAVTTPIIRQKEKRVTDLELHNRLAPQCRSWFVKRGEHIERLASTLGVAEWALDELKVGYDGLAWTFPERDHRELIIGVNRRLERGGKIMLIGSRRGLTYSDTWMQGAGPVLIVEGGSDTAAGLTLGLCVVGRPSCVGGVVYLTKLLGKVDGGRRIIVVGERDRKRHDDLPEVVKVRHKPGCRGCSLCYPGMAGAKATADKLWKALGRRVDWGYMPDGVKDMRAWLNASKADVNNETAIERLRASLLRRMK